MESSQFGSGFILLLTKLAQYRAELGLQYRAGLDVSQISSLGAGFGLPKIFYQSLCHVVHPGQQLAYFCHLKIIHMSLLIRTFPSFPLQAG